MPDDDTPPVGTDDTPPVIDPPVGDAPAGDTPADDTPPDGGTVLTDDKEPQGAPETYADFTVPDGVDINQPLLDLAKPIFKKHGLSQIAVQEIVDAVSTQNQADSQASSDSYNQTVKDWVDEAKSDTEIGGDNFDANVGLAKRAIDKFGTPKLIVVMNQTGLGNHPEFIRLFTRVGKLIKEDDPGGDTTPAVTDKTPAEILYPNEKAAAG